MSEEGRIPVTGRDSILGWIDPAEQQVENREMIVRLENGQVVRVPKDALERRPDGGYFLPVSREQIAAASQDRYSSEDDEVVIPVVAETLDVSKRQVTTGRVRVTKHVDEREELVDLPLMREEVDVQRVPVNRVVNPAPEVHYDGDTLIIPVLEEVLVVEKRLVLKEEVRVTRKRSEAHDPHTVTVREEKIDIQRVDNESPGDRPGRTTASD